MFNVDDEVQIVDTTIYPMLKTHTGIVRVAEPPNHIVDVAMYDVEIAGETYIFYHDELMLTSVAQIGAH